MSEKLLAPAQEKWIDRGDGVMHLLDASGSVIAVQKPQKNGSKRVQDTRTHTFMLDKNGRRVWVPRGTDLDETPYPLSEQTWEYVCQMIAEGKTLTSIGKMDGMPPERILRKWKEKDESFKALYVAAKKDRAEYRADKVLEIAENGPIAEEDVPGERLRKDVLQWGAEMDDRSAFGKQTKIVGDPDQPIVFQISTGVPEAAPIEVVSTVEGSHVGSP